jgi:hypothetical protein
MANWPVCLGVGLPSEAHDQIFVCCLTFVDFLLWAALSDEDGSVIYSYNCFWALQEHHSGFQVPQNSDHFFPSHLRLSQPGGSGPHIYIPQEKGGSVLNWLSGPLLGLHNPGQTKRVGGYTNYMLFSNERRTHTHTQSR